MNECSHRNQGTKKDFFSSSQICSSVCLFKINGMPDTNVFVLLPPLATHPSLYYNQDLQLLFFQESGREELAIHHGPYWPYWHSPHPTAVGTEGQPSTEPCPLMPDLCRDIHCCYVRDHITQLPASMGITKASTILMSYTLITSCANSLLPCEEL